MTRGLIDAVVLSGGSLFGLDAAGGATAVLVSQKRGAMFGGITLPVAVQAILFDLVNGGEKDWIREPMVHKPPYWDLGRDAALAAAADFALGTVGAGVGATTVNLKGGLGSASTRTQGFTVGALVAVNAVGSATHRRWPAILGRRLRAGLGVRRRGLAGQGAAGGAGDPLQGPAGASDGDVDCAGGDRRQAQQGRVQAARHHGQ
jgi:L-aminopeptidase/D-esterase-like protein